MSDEQKASQQSASRDQSYPDIPKSEDFERYGVWVKAGPEDVEEGDKEDAEGVEFGLDDLSDDEFLPSDEDTMLTAEEEDVLGDLEQSEAPSEDFPNLELPDEDEDEMSLQLDGEELSLSEEASPAATDVESVSSAESGSLGEDGEELLDVDIDLDEDIDGELEDLALDLEEEEEPSVEEPQDAESMQVEPTAQSAESGGAPDEASEMEDIEELSLDDLDSLELAEEETPAPGLISEEEPVAEEPAPAATPDARDADEDIDLDLDSIPGDDSLADFDFEDEDDTAEELPELAGDEEEEAAPLPEVQDDEETIDAELASVLDEEDIPTGMEPEAAPEETDYTLSEPEEPMSTAGTTTDEGRDESSVLVNIEKELLAIKNELNELKQELSTLRAGGTGAAESGRADVGDEDVEVSLGAPGGEKGGFFEEEDEDETIALTGDELDHILDTAEFTEQRGQPTEYDELDLRLDDSLSPGTSEQSADDSKAEAAEETEGGAPIEEITLEDMTGDSALEELESEPADTADELEELDLDLGGELGGEEEPASRATETTGEPSDEELTVDFEDLTESSGGDGEVDALAALDVDSELEGIEELSDEPVAHEGEPDTSDIDSIEIELPGEEDEEETGFAGADTDETEFEATLGGPVLEIPGEEEAQPSVEPAAVESADEEPEELDDLGDLDLEEVAEDEAETPGSSRTSESFGPAQPAGAGGAQRASTDALPENLKQEIRSVLSYMDQLLEALPEDKIEEFANSEHWETYKRLFDELGLETE